ncbi:P pilus assembly protein, porin PapC [Pseudomonas asplenii]|uniref:P pilus assembly protein, porin PapC n=1 Tax=Pseudomonas asplenii TaxID=53407 RepID=A0A0M9GGW0_9PSED|nr:fimbria/pilus outer membrane usher protein [Pseudomonas fuscovaginae]KPA90707.1 P pilus assembly protein, porin PapC [Pseudomonas fuscovaginae]
MTPFFRDRRPVWRQRLRYLLPVTGGSALWLASQCALAEPPIEFQSGFLHQHPGYAQEAGSQALKALGQQNDLGPGRYRVELLINQRPAGSRELDFSLDPKGNRLLPCLSAELLGTLGVKLDSLAETAPTPGGCVELARVIPGADSHFEGSQLRLEISVPQIAMRRDVIGYIAPEHWETGINAAFVNYQLSTQQSRHRLGGSSHSDDLYLNGGVNLGAWRLRGNRSLRLDDQGRREWNSAYSYAQRDLPGLNANLTLGDTFTSGDIFKSLAFRGAIIASDQDMLPDTLQSYAPIIRGTAQSRAKLEILQNGYPIYSTFVSPGPYEIDDLSTVASSGELEIVLTEADGQVQRFTQSYSTLSNLLREGVWRYSTAIGRHNAIGFDSDAPLWQGTLAVGTGWSSTLYGGLMGSDFYRAGNLGVARDLGSFGALALDLTHSSATIDAPATGKVQGLSYAMKYGKSFQTGTNLRFAGYRYSTAGYRDFEEAVRERERDTRFIGSRRSRLEASVYQKVGRQSSLNLTVSHQDYWQTHYTQRQFQFGFNTHHRGVSYSVFAQQSLSERPNTRVGEQRQFGLSVSLPLDFGSSSMLSFDLQNSAGRSSQRSSLSGQADDNRISYRTSVSRDAHDRYNTALSLGYQGASGNIGAGLTQGSNYRNASLNASGALLLHADGLEMGPYLGETAALVEVPDIAGIGVQNAAGVITNDRGFALVPYLRPYRANTLSLQTDQLGPEVEIDNGTAQVVPRRGAVVKTRFAARTVNRLLITALTAQGKPLPFGAQVSDAHGNPLGTVGQAGQVLLSIDPQVQRLEVRWGEDNGQGCPLWLDPQQLEQTQGYYVQTLTCQTSEPTAPSTQETT